MTSSSPTWRDVSTNGSRPANNARSTLPGIDLRNLANEVVLEVAGFGLMHLDAIAQEKGFFPMSGSRWNLV